MSTHEKPVDGEAERLTAAIVRCEAEIADCRTKMAGEEELLAEYLALEETAENEEFLRLGKKACRLGIKAWESSIKAYRMDIVVLRQQLAELLTGDPEARFDH